MGLVSRIVDTLKDLLKLNAPAAALLLAALAAAAQSSQTISGSVTDQRGAAVSGAQIAIMDRATGRVSGVRTNSEGKYTSAELPPSEYDLKVEARGFRTAKGSVALQEHVNATLNFRMEPPLVVADVEQPGVEITVPRFDLERLPLNGRIFLEATEMVPGLQTQDAPSFAPARAGSYSASIDGSSGSAPRFDFDHIDVTDEVRGGILQNIPLGAIEEFRVRESLPDLSIPLGAAGTVSVISRSGSDGLHGEGFYNFRDQAANASLPGANKKHFQRNQFGGSVGGAIVPGNLFFFLTAERNNQDFAMPVLPLGPFAGLKGTVDSPFRENQFAGRLDFNVSENARAFYRFSYDQNRGDTSPFATSAQVFGSDNHIQSHAGGIDFASGDYVHTLRVGYTRFHDKLSNAATGTGFLNPVPGVELGIGADPFCITPSLDQFCSGSSFLAPQDDYQSNLEFKYDGSQTHGAHDFRFGAGFARIEAAAITAYLANAPSVGASIADCARYSFCLPSDPTTYPVVNAVLGNGSGVFSEKSALGLNGGALPTDNRLTAYAGDIWKLKPNLVVRYGAAYVRDSGRTDSDLPAISSLNQFGPELGSRVHQPNTNFAPQLGAVWDPGNSGKTAVRGGVGLFYDNPLWQNTVFDRAGRLAQGSLHAIQPVCAGGITPPSGIPFPDGSVGTPSFCGQPLGVVAPQIAALQQQYQAAFATSAGSPVYSGNILADGINATGTSLLYPAYVTPRSVQMNLGLQHELREGMVLSVDYLRNVSTHFLESRDTNHVGAARYLDTSAALSAISTTNNALGCGPGTAAFDIVCAIAHGATIRDYAGNGLDSANTFCFGLPCSHFGSRPAAFPGANSALGTNQMQFPMGRSVYNGLHFSIKQESQNPFRNVAHLSSEISYTFSKFISTSRSSGLMNFATDNDNPHGFIGPSDLDRRHQASVSTVMDVPKNFRVSFVGRFYSPLPQTLTLEEPGAGAIFVSDVSGDGTDGSPISSGGIGDVLPGTNLGAFGRRTKAANINTAISYYNTNFSGRQTPAGQALINAGLFNLTELQAIGAVMPFVSPAPSDQKGNLWLKDFDLRVSWRYKLGERVELRPEVSFYNVFNFANFNSAANRLSGVLSGTSGAVNGTAGTQPAANRVGVGSGVFATGAPRMAEFTLKVSF
jgi:hypothetical protein